MAMSQKRAWRGRIRASIKRTSFDLVSLANYNAKHPTRYFLDAPQLAAVNAMQLVCQQLLAETVLR